MALARWLWCRNYGIAIAIVSLSACGILRNDVEVVGPDDWFRPSSERAVVIIGTGIQSQGRSSPDFIVSLAGPAYCWGIFSMTTSGIQIIATTKIPDIKYSVFSVPPGDYFYLGELQPPYGPIRV